MSAQKRKTGAAEDSSATPVIECGCCVSRRNPCVPHGIVATKAATFRILQDGTQICLILREKSRPITFSRRFELIGFEPLAELPR